MAKMSGPLRRMIGPARARLLKYMKEASSLLSRPVDEKSLEEDETRVEELVSRVEHTCSLLERCNRDWSIVLKDMKGEEKSKEEAEYQRFSEGEESFVETLLDAGDVVARLQSRLKVIAKTKARIDGEKVKAVVPKKGGDSEEECAGVEVKINLPKLQLPMFDGKIAEWQEFWDIFCCSIHEQNLPVVSKFTYLKTVLKGAALAAIAGIPVTADNYPLAIKTLKDRFGKKDAIIELLYSKLQNMPRSGNNFSQVKSTCDSVEKLLRQLEAQGEVVSNQRTLIQQIISKFPAEVITKFEETKGDPTISWTLKSLREALCYYVAVHENVHRYVNDYSGTGSHVKGQMSMYNNNVSGHVRGQLKPGKRWTDQSPHTAEVLTANSQQRANSSGGYRASLPCIFCKGSHFNDMCHSFPSLGERKQSLGKQGRCFVCLKTGHMMKECPSANKKSCCYCGKRGQHNRCLCPHRFTRPGIEALPVATTSALSQSTRSDGDSVDNPSPVTGDTSTQETTVTSNTALLASGERVLLQTAIVPLHSLNSSVVVVNAHVLLDSASQRTFMTEQLANRLKLRSEGTELLSVSTFGAGRAASMDTYVVQFQVKLKDGSYMKMYANVLKQITGGIRRGRLDQKDLEFLQMLPEEKLADFVPNTDEITNVDLLVGADYFWDIVGGEKVVLPSGMFMLPSRFGYIVTGRCPEGSHVQSSNPCALLVAVQLNQDTCDHILQCSVNVSLSDCPSLETLWSLENIGITDLLETNDDENALIRFNNTVKFVDGRYQVTWPWKAGNVLLPDNYKVAFDRLKSLVRRFRIDDKLLYSYDDTIKQQLSQKVIEIVDATERTNSRQYYLPHHPVLTPRKATTKLRIVYDASSKAKRDLNSLNECLYRGPVLLPDLCGVLLRFRVHPVVILADIEKAFLQVGIQECERDVTRFLWLKNPSNLEVENNLITFRFCRVPFGLICSPFLLAATIKLHLQKEGTPLAAHVLSNIYVDNILLTLDLNEDYHHIYRETKLMFQKAAMNLREWSSNCQEFLSSLPGDERVSSHVSKVLGLLWDQPEDTISISGFDRVRICSNVTKRDVLHSVAKVFDPLGLLIPLTLLGKLFLQRLWGMDKSWDEPLPEDLVKEWNDIVRNICGASSLRFDRFIGRVSGEFRQILVFCDASAKAYSTAIYLRTKCGNEYHTNLLFCKARLVPIGKSKKKAKFKHLTIPRLELMAVLIGVRASNFVIKELRCEISSRIVWTDSQCVLHWLNTRKPLPLFVENRTKEILREKNIVFRFIASSENPADIATRGLTASEIKENSLWWNGPLWLDQEESSWPTGNVADVAPEVLEELQGETKGVKLSTVTAAIDEDQLSLFGMKEKNCSSLRKLLRVSVYVMKFLKIMIWNKLEANRKESLQHCKLLVTVFDTLKETKPISSQEVRVVSLLWISAIQHKHFREVYVAIQKRKRHCLQMQLGIKIDEFDILRCHGRYSHTDLPQDVKCPKLLPRGEYYTYLLIQEVHQRLVHVGVSHTLSQIRQEFWIPQGRAEVRKVISKCVVCKRHSGPSFRLPNMPAWPRERVSQSAVFQYIGLDYLGPMNVKVGEIVEKMWICLFTCLSVRAVHLELVRGLSAQQFLDCLRRYIARRGRPQMIISDNAPQFRLVKTVLDKQWNEVFKNDDVLSFFSSQGITWKFTTALAPWQGGCYERLVALVKQALRKGIGRKLLLWDKLLTLLTEVEAIINTRPLTYVYGDFPSGFTLTPAHFLSGNLETVLPCETEDTDIDYQPKKDSAIELVDHWKKNQKQLEKFWKVWKNDYLLSLRETLPLRHRGSRSQLSREPKIGEVVILKEEFTPRRTWKLARIKDFIISKDGNIRSVVVELPNKHLISRSVNHVFPLELSAIQDTPNNTDGSNDETSTTTDDPTSTEGKEGHPCLRKAASRAKQRIAELMSEEATTVCFTFPRECHGGMKNSTSGDVI